MAHNSKGEWRANTPCYKKFGKALDIHTESMGSKLLRSLGTSGILVLKSLRCSLAFHPGLLLQGFLLPHFAAFQKFGVLLIIRSLRGHGKTFLFNFFFVQTYHSLTSAGL